MLPAQYYSDSEAEAYAWFRKNFKPAESHETLQELTDEPVIDFEKIREIPLFASGNRGRTVEPPFFKESSHIAQSKTPTQFTITRLKGEVQPKVSSSPKESVEDGEEDDDPNLALADMDYQFKKWAHSRREGVTSIPFAVAKAPFELHSAIAAWRSFPILNEASESNMATASADHSLQLLSQSALNMSAVTPAIRSYASSFTVGPSSSMQDENTGISKRAAMIAKQRSKATASTAGVLATSSASQKRAMQQKNRNRKPLIEPKAEAPSPKTKASLSKPEVHDQQVILRFDDNEESKKQVIQNALNEGLIDPDNEVQMKGLMMYLNVASTDKELAKDQDRGTQLERIEEIADGNEESEIKEKGMKTPRLKGKARKQVKKAAKK